MAGENKVQLEAALSIEKLLSELQATRNEADKLRQELAEANKKIKEGFDQSSAAARNMGTELSNALGRIDAQAKLIDKLNKELEEYRKNSNAAFDDTKLKQYQEQIKRLEAELAALKNQSAGAAQGVKNINSEVARTGGVMGKAKDVLSQFLGGFSLLAVAGPILNFLKDKALDLYDSIFGLSQQQKDLNEVMAGSKDAFVKATVEVENMKTVVDQAKNGIISKEEAVKVYNKTLGEALGTVQGFDEVEQRLVDGADAYIDAMAKRAAANLALQKAAQLTFDIEEERRKLDLTTAPDFVLDQIRRKTEEAKKQINNLFELAHDLNGEADKLLQPFQEASKAEQEDEKARLAARRSRSNALKNQREQEKEDEKERRRREAADRKAEAERLRALREEEARLQRILELEKQLSSLKIDLLGEGRQKDIAQENARFEAALKTLENLKSKSKTSAEEIKLIDQIIETQKQVHNKKLLDIDQKYFEEAAKAIEGAQKNIDSVLLSGREKELNDLSNRYQKIIDSINEARKKALEAGDKNDVVRVTVINASADNQIKEITDRQRQQINDINLKWDNLQLENEKDLALKSIDILKVQGLDEKKLTELKENFKLEVEKQYAKKRLDNLIKQLGLEQSLTEDNIKKLSSPDIFRQAQIEGQDVFQFLGIQIKESDPEKVKKIKAELLELIGIVNTQNKKPDEDLFDFLGIDTDMAGKIKTIVAGVSTIGQVASEALSPFIDGYDRRIDAIQRLIDKLDEQISAQEDAVEREKELAEQGYANNLDIEERRLADLKSQREQELEEEKRLQEEKKKIQKAQILADTVAQGSNLITASTEIFKVMSKLGPVGIILAIASIGAMLTGFVAAKVQALKAVGDAPVFAKGDRFDIYNALKGASSHGEGGVDVVDNKTGRKLAEFEGDEKLFIVNKGSSKKYEPVLDAINKDQLSNWTYDDLVKFVRPSGMIMNKERHGHVMESRDRVTVVNNHIHGASDKSEMYLKEIAETNRQLLQMEKDKEETIELPDRTIKKKGNHTRIIHKS